MSVLQTNIGSRPVSDQLSSIGESSNHSSRKTLNSANNNNNGSSSSLLNDKQFNNSTNLQKFQAQASTPNSKYKNLENSVLSKAIHDIRSRKRSGGVRSARRVIEINSDLILMKGARSQSNNTRVGDLEHVEYNDSEDFVIQENGNSSEVIMRLPSNNSDDYNKIIADELRRGFSGAEFDSDPPPTLLKATTPAACITPVSVSKRVDSKNPGYGKRYEEENSNVAQKDMAL